MLRLDSPHVELGLPRPKTNADPHKALDAPPPDYRRAVFLGAYPGLPVSEAAALDWSEVDLEQDRELIPAQAHQQVACAQALAQTGARLDQHLVSHVVAQGRR
jgi:integrase